MKNMKKLVTIVLATALLLAFCTTVWAINQPAMSRQQLRRNVAYRNALPLSWRYEAGYALWRISRNMPANPISYRKYRNDRVWHQRMHHHYGTERFLLNTIDWTVEEVAIFMHRYQDLFKFHPAGIE